VKAAEIPTSKDPMDSSRAYSDLLAVFPTSCEIEYVVWI